MGTQMFLGEPPFNVKRWIIEHAQPAGHAETWYKYAGDAEWKTAGLKGQIFKSDGGISSDGGDGFIENYANIAAIEIGTEVTSIGNYAFYDCSNLTSVTIGNGVTSIGNGAFRGCIGLTSVTIPDSVESIGEGVFLNCNGLSEMSMLGFTCDYVKANVYGWGIAVPNKQLVTIQCSDGYVILNDQSQSSDGKENLNGKVLFKTSAGGKWKKEDADISNGTFNGFASKFNAVEVIIPSKDTSGNDITSIGSYAFFNCTNLTSVTISDSVTAIGSYAFYGCTNLTSVTIPNSVTSIGYEAFRGCSGLTSVTIGNGVTSIGDYAFDGCSGLTSVTIGNGVEWIGEGAFDGCSGLMSVTIPSSVTDIGWGAFYGCSSISEMSMLGFTCDYVKANAYHWRIAVPAKQLVTIQCSDGYVILNDQSQSSDGKTNA